jgi:hypothetical protein
MVLVILALVLIGVVMGAAGMRRIGALARRVTGPWRPGVAILALISFLGAGALIVRGAEIEGGVLAAVGLLLAMTARRRAAARTQPSTPHSSHRMSVDEARRMLGVAPTASAVEIEAAFRRLMQRAHPDLGGTSGLAAQLNAAREALIGARQT